MSQSLDLRIDSHKLVFHPKRTAQWLDDKSIYPIYMEISPAGACNHRCIFCAKDYMGYRPNFLNTDMLMRRLGELGALGVCSVMYGGEGEPLLHRDIASIIKQTKAAGIDVAMSTNAVLLTPDLAAQILASMSWLKVSINAGTPEGYGQIHHTDPKDFRIVLQNIEASAQLISKNNWGCTLGTQAVLLPDNAAELHLLAERVKNTGARYLVIKPYSQHHKSNNRTYADIDYNPYLELEEQLEGYNDHNFSVIFRSNTFRKMQREERGYERCLALPFWSYIDSQGDVWACSSHMGDDRYRYGNINEQSFQEIWQGDRRKQSLEFVASELDPETCRMNCRMDEINLYLWELTHPSGHVNFI